MVKEEIDRQIENNRAYVARHKMAPGALTGFSPAEHISPDCDLATLGAELEQFALDARARADSRGDLADQVTDVGAYLGSVQRNRHRQ